MVDAIVNTIGFPLVGTYVHSIYSTTFTHYIYDRGKALLKQLLSQRMLPHKICCSHFIVYPSFVHLPNLIISLI